MNSKFGRKKGSKVDFYGGGRILCFFDEFTSHIIEVLGSRRAFVWVKTAVPAFGSLRIALLNG